MVAAPDDHFTATPNRGMTASAVGGVGGAGSCPTVRAGIISAACVCVAATYESAPDNHFMAGPDCRVKSRSTLGSIGHGGSCPSVRARENTSHQVLKGASALLPPQMIITVPVHTAVWL